MSCSNCNIFKNKCQAECCSFVPIDRDIFINNFSKISIPIIKLIDLENNMVIPETATGKCTFLNSELECNIYDQRPDICNKFGDETHINMTCRFQTKNGQKRTNKEKLKIEKLQNNLLENFINKNKKQI